MVLNQSNIEDATNVINKKNGHNHWRENCRCRYAVDVYELSHDFHFVNSIYSNFDIQKGEGWQGSVIAPDLFNRYIIVSPSIWLDDWFYSRDERYVMKELKHLMEANTTRKPVYI